MQLRMLRQIVAVAVTAAAISFTPQVADAAQGTRPCASYSYCFFDNRDYNKYRDPQRPKPWKLTYKDTKFGHFSNPPYNNNFNRNVRDQLSSVINNTSKRLCVYNVTKDQRHELLFQVRPFEDKRYVGHSDNDKADYWRAVPRNIACPV